MYQPWYNFPGPPWCRIRDVQHVLAGAVKGRALRFGGACGAGKNYTMIGTSLGIPRTGPVARPRIRDTGIPACPRDLPALYQLWYIRPCTNLGITFQPCPGAGSGASSTSPPRAPWRAGPGPLGRRPGRAGTCTNSGISGLVPILVYFSSPAPEPDPGRPARPLRGRLWDVHWILAGPEEPPKVIPTLVHPRPGRWLGDPGGRALHFWRRPGG